MGSIDEHHSNVIPPVILALHIREGHRRHLVQDRLGPDCNSSYGRGFMGRKHPTSRISRAKAQKQELVVCRDWQAGSLAEIKEKESSKQTRCRKEDLNGDLTS